MRNSVNRIDRFASMQSDSANSDWLGSGLALLHPYSEN